MSQFLRDLEEVSKAAPSASRYAGRAVLPSAARKILIYQEISHYSDRYNR